MRGTKRDATTMSHEQTGLMLSLRASSMKHYGQSYVECMALHCKCRTSSADFEYNAGLYSSTYAAPDVLGTLCISRWRKTWVFFPVRRGWRQNLTCCSLSLYGMRSANCAARRLHLRCLLANNTGAHGSVRLTPGVEYDAACLPVCVCVCVDVLMSKVYLHTGGYLRFLRTERTGS